MNPRPLRGTHPTDAKGKSRDRTDVRAALFLVLTALGVALLTTVTDNGVYAATDDCEGGRFTTCSYDQGDTVNYFSFNSSGDIDWIWMWMSKEEMYTISVASDNASGERVVGVYDYDGDSVATSGSSSMTFTAPETDYYFIAVTADSEGRYELRVEDESVWEPAREYLNALNDDDLPASTSTKGRIAVGGFSVGHLDKRTLREEAGFEWFDSDWFRMELHQNRQYTLRLVPNLVRGYGDPAPRATIRSLRDSEGSAIRQAIFGNEITFRPGATGTYYIEATLHWNVREDTWAERAEMEGTYEIYLTQIRHITDNTRTGGDLKPDGETFLNNFLGLATADEVHWFTIDLEAGKNYLFRTFGRKNCGVVFSCGPLPTDVSKWVFDPVVAGIYSRGGNLLSPGGQSDVYAYRADRTGRHHVSIGAATGGSPDRRTGFYGVRARNDDYLDDERTAGEITLVDGFGSISGEVELVVDVDFIKLRLQVGRTYQFDVEGADTGQGTLQDPEIYFLKGPIASDPCELLFLCNTYYIPGTSDQNSGTSRNARVVYTPVETATHYIALGGRTYFVGLGLSRRKSSGTGSYTVSLKQIDDYAASTKTAGAIVVDDPVGGKGEIEQTDDADWYAVDLLSGYTYTFSVLSATGVENPLGDPDVGGIYDSGGSLIADSGNDSSRDDGLGVELSFQATSSGTHYISVRGKPESEGATVDNLGFYRVGAVLDTNVDRVIPETPTEDTADVPHDSTSSARVVLHQGTGEYEGDIETSCDVDWIGATLIGGREYLLEVEGSDTSKGTLRDPKLYSVRNSLGHIFDRNQHHDDISSTNRNVRMKYRARRTETHFLVIGPSASVAPGHDPSTGGLSCSGTGTYTVTVTEIDDFAPGTGTTGVVTVGGDTAFGNVQSDDDHDWFAVDFSEGDSYRVTIASHEDTTRALEDPALASIRDPDGNSISATSNDDRGGGSSKDARLFYVAERSGTHFVAVTTASKASVKTGLYGVTVVRDDYADDTGFAVSGSFTDGVAITIAEVEEVGDVDWHAFDLAPAHRYLATVVGDDSGGRALRTPRLLEVYDSSGELVDGTGLEDRSSASEGDCSESAASSEETLQCFVVGTAGTYYVAAGGGTESVRNPRRLTGHYSVVVRDIEPPVVASVELTSDPGVDSRYDAGDVIELTVTFDEEVDLSGSASLDLVVGGRVRSAASASGSDQSGDSVVFEYTVLADDLDTDGVSVPPDALSLAEGVTLQDKAANDAVLTLAGLGHQAGHTVGDPDSVQADDFPASTGTSGSVAVDGTPVYGSIEQSGDVDWFAVTLTSATSYRIEVDSYGGMSTELPDPELRGIYDASGTLVAGTGNDDRGSSSKNARGHYLATATGRHFVAVSGASKTTSNTGLYSVAMVVDDYSADSSHPASMSLTGAIARSNGEVEVLGDVDWHMVTLNAGQTYAASVVDDGGRGQRGLRTPKLVGVYDSNGMLLTGTGLADRSASGSGDCRGAPDSTEESLECFAIATTGTYYVAARGGETAKNPLRLIGRYEVVLRDRGYPSVTGVAFFSDPGTKGYYAAGDVILARVTFSEPVTLSFSEDVALADSASLELTIGASNKLASRSIFGGSDSLVFMYTVVSADADEDGVGIPENALTLVENATLRDTHGHDAVLEFDAVEDQEVHAVGSSGVPRVRFGEAAYATAEDGDETPVTVTLSRGLSRTVVIPLRFAGVDGATHRDWDAPESVEFLTGETSKTFSVTAVNDRLDDDGESVAITFGTLPQGVGAGFLTRTDVTLTDDDERGLSVELQELVVPLNGSESYSVRLSSKPTSTVTVTLTAAGVDVSPGELSFEPGDWRVPQTVTVTASMVGEGSITHSATGGDYSSVTVVVAVTVADERLVATLDSTSYDAAEGGDGAMIMVLLNDEADESLTIPLLVSNISTTDDDWTVSMSVEFAVGETDKTVVLTATDDDVDDDGESVRVSFFSLPDTVVAGEVREATVLLADNDERGLELSETTLNVVVGGAASTYTVALASQPTSTVTVTITTPAGVSASPSELTFAPLAWSSAQTVTVTATAAGSGAISHGAAGGDYGSQSASISVVTTDAGPRVTGVELTSNAGTDRRYDVGDTIEATVAFNEAVTLVGNAHLQLSIGTEARNASYHWSPNTRNMVFSYMVVSGDADANGVSIAANALVLGANANIRDNDDNDADLTFAAIDNQPDHLVGTTDVPQVGFGKPRYVAGEGAAVIVTVTLSTSLASPVTIPFVGSGQNGAEPEDWTAPVSVRFSAGQTSRTVLVNAVDDNIDETPPPPADPNYVWDPYESGERVLMAFGALPESVTEGEDNETVVVLLDNDRRELVLSPQSLDFPVGDTGESYRVSLGSQPTDTVTVRISALGVEVNPSELTFAPGQWSSPQTVTVTATSAATGIVLHNATGGDYGAETATLNFVATDNTLRVSFEQAAYQAIEGGDAAVVVAKLSPAPSQSVTITLESTGTAGADEDDYVVATTLRFNRGQTSRSFTVTAVDDGDDDDGEGVTFSFGSLPEGVEAGSRSETVVSLIDNDGSAPVLLSASVDSDELRLVYDRDLDTTSVPPWTAFGLNKDGRESVLFDVRISGDTVELTLDIPVGPGETVRVDYTPPVDDPAIRGTRLSPAAPLVGQLVEVLAPTPQDISKGICARTPAVRDGFVAAARTRYTWVKDCTEMTPEHLAEMERLYLTDMYISAVKPGDFDDLTNLVYLQLASNSISHLPEGLFSDLAKLTTLDLTHNSLTNVVSLRDRLLSEIPNLTEDGLDLRFQE